LYLTPLCPPPALIIGVFNPPFPHGFAAALKVIRVFIEPALLCCLFALLAAFKACTGFLAMAQTAISAKKAAAE
jgi:hypothetical protein